MVVCIWDPRQKQLDLCGSLSASLVSLANSCPERRQSLKYQSGISEVDHWIKALAAKPNDLSSNLETYSAEGENPLLHLLWPPHLHHGSMNMKTHTHTN